MLKKSKYNLFVEIEDRKFAYNQLRSSILETDEELFQALKCGDINSFEHNVREELIDQGFLCDSSLKEENIVIARSKIQRFSGKHARVTILPTVDCNFSCWYCYENHKHSFMTEEATTSVILFCKDILSRDSVQSFHLDWFGGEPLLYFNQIVIPISQEVHKMCIETNTTFMNTITTNGCLLSEDMIREMKKIRLTGFQITLDGGKRFHNKTRFSKGITNSFDIIVENIIMLCRSIANINMTLRINYTPKNINSINEIVELFPKDVRGKIEVVPQLVWQFKERDNYLTDKIKQIMHSFSNAGYKRTFDDLSCTHCYVENMQQYVVNYDLSVFKCTARDFVPSHSIGQIDEGGKFKPSSHYYDYFTSSAFENERCLECHLLPSCLNSCLQKKIEGNIRPCDKHEIERSVINRVQLYISNCN